MRDAAERCCTGEWQLYTCGEGHELRWMSVMRGVSDGMEAEGWGPAKGHVINASRS